MNQEHDPSTEIEDKANKHPVFQVTKVSKCLAMLLFIVMPFIGGWIGHQLALGSVNGVQNVSITVPDDASDSASEQKYKKTFLGGEIPFEWNELSVSKTSVRKGELPSFSNVRYSISSEKIQFGDGAWKQIDFHYLEEGVAEELIAMASQEDGVKVNESTLELVLGGTQTMVIQYPLDNDEVTKAGTGGTTYITAIPEDQIQDSGYPTHLLITKWALGDERFEESFRHYLDTADFSELIK